MSLTVIDAEKKKRRSGKLGGAGVKRESRRASLLIVSSHWPEQPRGQRFHFNHPPGLPIASPNPQWVSAHFLIHCHTRCTCTAYRRPLTKTFFADVCRVEDSFENVVFHQRGT